MIIYIGIDVRGNYLNTLEIGENYLNIFKQNLIYKYSIIIINFILIFIIIYITNKFIKKGLKNFFEEDNIRNAKIT